MRVVFISPHSDPEASLGEPDAGGQCVYERELGKALSEIPNLEVIIMCRQTHKRPDITALSDNCKVYRITCGSPGFIPKENIEAYLLEFTHKAKLLIRDLSDVVLHAHYWDGGKASLQLKRLVDINVPLVWTPHSLGVLKRRKFAGVANELFYNFIPRLTWENYTALLSQAMIVSSEGEKATLINEYAVPQKKVHIIPPGIDFSHLQQIEPPKARERLDLPRDVPLLLCLGRMSPSKGYQYAIRAVYSLKKLYNLEVFLVICGGSPQDLSPEEAQYLQELRGLAKSMSVEKNIIFRSAIPHDQVHQMYSAADVNLMVSEHEPFGLTVLEAMAMKTPVVAANKGGPADIILHNSTGCLVDVRDHARLAHYILTLLKDTRFKNKIITNAYEYVTMEYEWKSKAMLFHQIYTKVKTLPLKNDFYEIVQSHYFLQHNL